MENKRKDFNPTGISLTKVEAKIVNEESERRGINNFSAMARVIIREWAEMKGIQVGTGKVKK